MAKGKAVLEVVHWIIICLSTIMTEDEISMYTNVGMRSVQKILSYFKQTSDVNVPQWMKCQIHKSLCDYDIEVCNL
jgi:hypothetical protein